MVNTIKKTSICNSQLLLSSIYTISKFAQFFFNLCWLKADPRISVF